MNLQQASRLLFKKSQHFLTTAFIAGMVVYAASVLSLFAHDPLSDLEVILVIAGAQILQVYAKYRAFHWFGLADTVRRMHQMEDGLGVKPASLKLFEAEAAVGICDAPSDPGYWFTKLPVGPRRLVEMIEESAFYTADLSERSGNILRVFALCGIALCVVSLVIATRLGVVGTAGEITSHIVVASLAFFLAGDLLIMSSQYFDLRNAARSTLQDARNLLSKGDVSREETTSFAMEYNSAVAQAPPVSSFIYNRNRTRLEKLFSSFKKAG